MRIITRDRRREIFLALTSVFECAGVLYTNGVFCILMNFGSSVIPLSVSAVLCLVGVSGLFIFDCSVYLD